MESRSTVNLPRDGYDATLCPLCTGDSTVKGGKGNTRGNWMLRRRVCKECGFIWRTVEMYASRLRPGVAPRGAENCRVIALEVDALDTDAVGPMVMSPARTEEKTEE